MKKTKVRKKKTSKKTTRKRKKFSYSDFLEMFKKRDYVKLTRKLVNLVDKEQLIRLTLTVIVKEFCNSFHKETSRFSSAINLYLKSKDEEVLNSYMKYYLSDYYDYLSEAELAKKSHFVVFKSIQRYYIYGLQKNNSNRKDFMYVFLSIANMNYPYLKKEPFWEDLVFSLAKIQWPDKADKLEILWKSPK